MASDLSEVVFLEGEAQRLQKLSNLISGLIGKIRREGLGIEVDLCYLRLV